MEITIWNCRDQAYEDFCRENKMEFLEWLADDILAAIAGGEHLDKDLFRQFCFEDDSGFDDWLAKRQQKEEKTAWQY